ncbi:MAG: 3-carboxy-cis,cis-muconate cycloisomerase, partial [Betaproteobacteria bacterium]|nr:3-carboxy-cis,cis-muconate cycloisomerase [Betaproteobacteria bacterium]
MTVLQNAFRDETCADLFSDARLLAAMARFEAALADASSKSGILSAADAKLIAQVCAVAKFDAVALARDARRAGTLAIPFVRSLTAQVAAVSPQAARWVHFGATSQDLIDTAVVLCLKASTARLLELSRRVGEAAAALAKAHGGTPTVARTMLQTAVPVPFGWKAAVWLCLVGRCHAAFARAARDSQVLQF